MSKRKLSLDEQIVPKRQASHHLDAPADGEEQWEWKEFAYGAASDAENRNTIQVLFPFGEPKSGKAEKESKKTPKSKKSPGKVAKEAKKVEDVASTARKYWIIFIHGGGWRDPEMDAKTFYPNAHKLLTNKAYKSLQSSIEAFATIEYRLSPYPAHKTDPSFDDDKSRNAHHPDHLNDIKDALRFVTEKWGEKDYLLVGHSVGATLALQAIAQEKSAPAETKVEDKLAPVAEDAAEGEASTADKTETKKDTMKELKRDAKRPQTPLTAEKLHFPRAILGVAGVYSFEEMIKAGGMSKDIVVNAYGEDADIQTPAPVSLDFSEWKRKKGAIVLAHSPEDEYIPPLQTLAMRDTFVEQKVFGKLMNTRGKHDEIWAKGGTLPGLIADTLEFVLEQDSKTTAVAPIESAATDPTEASAEASTSEPAVVKPEAVVAKPEVDLKGWEGFDDWKPKEEKKPVAKEPIRLPILKRFLSFLTGGGSQDRAAKEEAPAKAAEDSPKKA